MKLSSEQVIQFIEDGEIDGYEIIQDKLQSDQIDEGDANPHDVIIKKDDKYYMFTYDEWIGPDLCEDDVDNNLVEVIPFKETIISYKIKQ